MLQIMECRLLRCALQRDIFGCFTAVAHYHRRTAARWRSLGTCTCLRYVFLTVSNAQPLPSWACAWQRLWTISRQSGPGQSDAKLIHCHFPQGSSFLNRATLVSSCPVRGRHMQKRVLASDWPHAVPPRRAACSMELQSELTVMSFSATLNSALHYKPSARGGLSGTR